MELYIDRKVAESEIAVAMQSKIKTPAHILDDAKPLFQKILETPDPIQKGKEVLYLTRNKGAFIRECPGTREYTCCGYKILHIGTYCMMDCAYCILQSYFHPPLLQYFTNHDSMLSELQALFQQDEISRVGTGEFTDSLIWERWTPLSKLLVTQFANQSRAVLELKTKTTAIQSLASLEHNRKTIVSWSLNTPEIIASQERGTASLDARIAAAAKCQSRGYPLAFHFDPMVIYEGCEAEYNKVVEKLFSTISPESIVWISMGSLRFMPALKSIIQQRFPESKMVYGEFVPGLDGKMRYFQPLRIKLYKTVYETIKSIAPKVMVYLCMENDRVWEKSFGFVPEQYGGLPQMLDDSAARCCGLNLKGGDNQRRKNRIDA